MKNDYLYFSNNIVNNILKSSTPRGLSKDSQKQRR